MRLSALSLPAPTDFALRWTDAAVPDRPPAGKVFGSSHVEELMALFLDPRDKSDVIARGMERATLSPTAHRSVYISDVSHARRAR